MSTATTLTDHPAHAAAPAPRVWFGWSCPVCVSESAPAATEAEALYLAGVHDAMNHRGDPTTYLHTTTTTSATIATTGTTTRAGGETR